MSGPDEKPLAPWVEVKDVCHLYGYTYGTFKNKILDGTAPVQTSKLGRKLVIARSTHEKFLQDLEKLSFT